MRKWWKKRRRQNGKLRIGFCVRIHFIYVLPFLLYVFFFARSLLVARQIKPIFFRSLFFATSTWLFFASLFFLFLYLILRFTTFHTNWHRYFMCFALFALSSDRVYLARSALIHSWCSRSCNSCLGISCTIRSSFFARSSRPFVLYVEIALFCRSQVKGNEIKWSRNAKEKESE